MKVLKRIELDSITGFRNVALTRVVILDEFGKTFYDSELVDGPVYEFNLPAGEYYLQCGKIQPLHSPVKYKLAPLPPVQRSGYPKPDNFNFEFAENPNTASIFWDKRKIVLDTELRKLSIPELMYIIYHEFAHQYYKDEKACDTYAMNKMLREGYNPEQISAAIQNTLSGNQLHRAERITRLAAQA